MATRTVPVHLPEELVELLGSAEEASERTRLALVLDLLREARISQGKAAEVLGITRWDILDLMARYRIESGPETEEDMRTELKLMRETAGRAAADASRQQQ